MTSWIRFAVTFLRSSLKPKLRPGDNYVFNFRIWPQECDLKFINNGKVLTLLEMGRLDFMVRSGAFKRVFSEGMYIPVGSLSATYHRPIKRFQKIQMHTKIVGWDDRWFFFRQDIYSGEKVYLSAIIRTMAKKNGKAVPPEVFIAELGGGPFPYLDAKDLDLARRMDAPQNAEAATPQA